MIVKIIIVGKTKEKALSSLQKTYLERLRRYTRVEMVAIQKGQPHPGRDVLQVESERILREIKKGDVLIVLDRRGQEMSSEQLATFLEKQLMAGSKRIVFVTGGAAGLDRAISDRAGLRLSFSRLTFTHEMIRVLLLEQLYRAWTLIRGEKYHK